MKWLGISFIIFIAAWAVFVCFGAATYDSDGNKVTGWRRWLRFIYILPWPL